MLSCLWTIPLRESITSIASEVMSAIKQSFFMYSTLSGKKCAQQQEMKDLQLKVYLWRVGAVYKLVLLCSEIVLHFYKDVRCIACWIQIPRLYILQVKIKVFVNECWTTQLCQYCFPDQLQCKGLYIKYSNCEIMQGLGDVIGLRHQQSSVISMLGYSNICIKSNRAVVRVSCESGTVLQSKPGQSVYSMLLSAFSLDSM